jgi:hypothetical protein
MMRTTKRLHPDTKEATSVPCKVLYFVAYIRCDIFVCVLETEIRVCKQFGKSIFD